jgi:YesN/AraC family two-component response regulator
MKKQKEHSLLFNDVHIDPKHQIGMHKQHTWELSYVDVGSGIRTIGDTSEGFRSGEVVLIPPEIPHGWTFGEDDVDENGCIANISIMFEDNFMDDCASSFPELNEMIFMLKSNTDAIILNHKKSEPVVCLLRRMIHESDAERVATFIRVLITVAESEEYRIIGHPKEMNRETLLFNKVQTYIRCNYRRPISLDEISAYMGMNRSSFCIFFKRAIGKSLVNYLNEVRIDCACEHLKKRDANISEICYLSGFNDIPYFNRVFKKMKGVSPREYRHGGKE